MCIAGCRPTSPSHAGQLVCPLLQRPFLTSLVRAHCERDAQHGCFPCGFLNTVDGRDDGVPLLVDAILAHTQEHGTAAAEITQNNDLSFSHPDLT